MPKVQFSTCAKDGGANQSTYKLPPPSQDYRNNYDAIFRKSKPATRVQPDKSQAASH